MESPRQIRLLDLLPPGLSEDTATAHIRCATRPVKLPAKSGGGGAPEQYEALSYVWGPETLLVSITVNSDVVQITPSLLLALRQLRLADRPRTLWIDQLCINQWDSAEKAQQVRLMRDIYSSCSRCIVWLGDIPHERGVALEDAQAALDTIRYIAAGADATDDDDDDYGPVPPCLADVGSAAAQRAVDALGCIVWQGNHWWRRVWTVQEAVLPPAVALAWGPLALLPWDALEGAASVMNGSRGVFPARLWRLWNASAANSAIFVQLLSNTVWLSIARARSDEPLMVMRRWRGRATSEPRDNVYGLLGLLSRPGSLPLTERCDYAAPLPVVFARLTVELILDEGGLRPLVTDPWLEPDLASPVPLPRWCLDMKDYPRSDTDWFHLYGYRHYDACGGLEPCDLPELASAAARDEYRILRLRGVAVDRVQETRPGPGPWRSPALALQRILKEWWAMLLDRPYGEPFYDDLDGAFASLLVGDMVRDTEQWPAHPATADDRSEVTRFRETGHVDPLLFATVYGMMRNQTFFVTDGGLIGLGQLETRPGDEVWVLRGGRVPFTLRPRAADRGGGDEFDFVGRCHVQGIMYGEAAESPLRGRFLAAREREVRLH